MSFYVLFAKSPDPGEQLPIAHKKRDSFVLESLFCGEDVPAASYFPRGVPQVSSALEGLTSEFGMGSGVAPPPWPPEQNL